MPKKKDELNLLTAIDTIGGQFRVSHTRYNIEPDESAGTIMITTIYLKIGQRYYKGHAKCGAEDQFNRRLGRVIALGRAFKHYKMNLRITPHLSPLGKARDEFIKRWSSIPESQVPPYFRIWTATDGVK